MSSSRRGAVLFPWTLLLLLFLDSATEAHRLHVYAQPVANQVVGCVFDGAGNGAAHVRVVVQGPAGRSLGQTRTDGEGFFRFPVADKVPYTFLVETSAGHGGSHTVSVEELSATLDPSPHDREPVAAVELAMAHQLLLARRQTAERDGESRLRDVVGGVGYILGLGGIGFYFLAARRRRDGRGLGE